MSQRQQAVRSFKVGDVIGGEFEILQRPNAGGQGQVYLCYSALSDCFYALKGVNPHRRSWEMAFFQREVETWIALGHQENIVRCFTVLTVDEQPFILSEWIGDDYWLARTYAQRHAKSPWFFDWYSRLGVEGARLRKAAIEHPVERYHADLQSLIESGVVRGSTEDGLRIALELCGGLIQINRVFPTVAHGDLKPTNVLLTMSGAAKLNDFGMVRAVGGGQHLSHLHMAPEQWRGEPIDCRTDIYALGVILYTLLEGTEPYNLPSKKDTGQLHLYAPLPTIPFQLTGALAINQIVQTCLAKAPQDRFQTPEELFAALAGAYLALTGRFRMPPMVNPPVTIEAHYHLGIAHTWLGEKTRAFAHFEAAIQIDSTHPAPYVGRSVLYLGDKPNQARRDLEQAARVRRAFPDLERDKASLRTHTAIQHNLAIIYFGYGEYERALEELVGVELVTNVLLTRGAIHMALHQFDAAIRDFDRVVVRAPDHAVAHFNRALANFCLGNGDAARTDLLYASEFAGIDAPNQTPDFAWVVNHLQLGEPMYPPVASLSPVRVQMEAELLTALARQQHFVRHDQDIPSIYFRIANVQYADELHDTVLARQQRGELVTQVRVTGAIFYADGCSGEMLQWLLSSSIQTPLPLDFLDAPIANDLKNWEHGSPKAFTVVLDMSATHMLAAEGLQRIEDLVHREVCLHYLNPLDRSAPLQLSHLLA
jgi:serine/threonine protein kinase